MLVQFIVSGALVGFLVGATGVGGGSLMTPLLTLFFGIPAQVAVGTDLIFASITKSSGAIAYARRGNIPWAVVARMAAGSIPASLATITVLHAWHPDAARFATLVRPVLGAALLITAVAVVFRERIRAWSQGLGVAAPVLAGAAAGAAGAPTLGSFDDLRTMQTVAAGALIGVLVTLTSVGAGAIGVVALYVLYPSLTPQKLVGADIVHAVPLTLVAGLGHASLGTIDWTMLMGLLIGSLPAIHLGAVVANRMPANALRIALAAVLTLIGTRLILV